MEKRQSIHDIRPQDEVQSVFLLGAAARHQARNGPYWRLELRDAGGSAEAKIWSPESEAYSELVPGTFLEVFGKASLYREQIQITVSRLRFLSDEETRALDLRDFLAASSRNPMDMLADIEALCRAELHHEPWRKCALAILQDEDIHARLLVAPAAKALHHAYAGGLVEHMLSVAQLSMRMADQYPELDRQILLFAALFHDLGKVWELSGGLINDYTDEGRLIGHITLGLEHLAVFWQKAKIAPELMMHLRHLILSHHGFLEFGSPQVPKTPEALALHSADMLDARLAQCRELFGRVDTEEPVWTDYQKSLERQLYRAAPTPDSESQAAQRSRSNRRSIPAESPDTKQDSKQDSKAAKAEQCFLL